MLRLMMLAGLATLALSTGPARACDPDDVTNDRCDFGDRASGRMPAETWGDYAARRQAEVERAISAMPDAGQDGGGRRGHR